MARIRTIKPSFFVNEQLADLKPVARLLFIGLWTLADKSGKIENRPKRIKAELMPFDSIRVEPLLNDLESSGFITQYEAEGRKVIKIINFRKHQRPHPKEPDSELPDQEPCKSPAEPGKGSSEPWKKTAGCALREGVSLREGKESHSKHENSRPEFGTDGPKDPDHWPDWFVAEWVTYYHGGVDSQRRPENIKPVMRELIRQKIPPEKIRDRIRDPSRDRKEPLYQFANHWKPSHAADKHRAATPRNRHTFVPDAVPADAGTGGGS